MSDDPFRARGPIPGARGKTDFKDHTDTEAEESASAGAANVLDADRDEVTRFVSALFRYADNHSYASLRAFDQFIATSRLN
jgi:hypothetical protein